MIHSDHLGTPQKMTDSSGTVVWAADYKPFGEATVNPSSTITNNLRFTGQYFDAETGLLYNMNRTYNKDLGRYIEADPIGIQRGRNHLYVYAENNPLRWTDPYGLAVYICSRPLSGMDNRYGSLRHDFISINKSENWGFFCRGCSHHGAGEIKVNFETDYSSCTEQKCVDENKLRQNIQQSMSSRPYYHLVEFNCQAWAFKMVNNAKKPASECCNQ
jgi:RHS repeat-associated protein